MFNMRLHHLNLIAALLLTACASSGMKIPETRNFDISAMPASAPVNADLKPIITAAGQSYLTLVVATDTSKSAGFANRNGVTERLLTAGSGFLIDENHALTAAHVAVEKGLPAEARGPDNALYRSKILAIRPRSDVALVEVRGLTAGTPVHPAASACLSKGEAVFSLGKPHAAGDTARLGTLEAMRFGRPVTYDRYGYQDAMVLKMATRRGESGGPLFNARGELVGMIVSTLADDTGKPLDLAHALPLPVLADFICSEGTCAPEWAALRNQSINDCKS